MRPTYLLTAAAVASSLLLAACGGNAKTSSGGAARAADTVSVKHVGGLGAVLVAAGGKALYSPEHDTAKMIHCTGQCLSFWTPLAPGAGKPTAAAGVPALGVIKRPDGMRQVTAAGKPLYTFSEDSSGKITGDGFTDKFGGRTFVWHVALAGGGAAPAPKSTPSGSGSYGY